MTTEHPTHTPAQIEAALAEFDGTGWVDEDAFPGNTAALREVLTRALAAADGAAWQPMETAPMDGAEVIVFRILPDRHEVCSDIYLNDPSSVLHGWLPGCTAWRPLPAPPEGV